MAIIRNKFFVFAVLVSYFRYPIGDAIVNPTEQDVWLTRITLTSNSKSYLFSSSV
ncbi:hypothetical protein [Myxosarcina sp. GI1]|uniref:hypothetical protein n=1 Tax=Myxosarcina sp. GI1 TaxID=1541065 RepID=UPI0012E0B83A|nr:hypothetical protein [Myxosarcina sp. GI1]